MSYILESIISGLLLGLIYALLSVGFGLTWGTMKILNIAHAVFAVLGAFLAYWIFVKVKLDPILSLPFLAALMFLIGAVVYKLAVRPVTRAKDVVMASMVATFGVATVVENLMSYFWRPDPRVLKPVYSGSSLFIGDISISVGPLIGCAISLCSIALIYWFLHRTYTGKGVQATWQNPTGAALAGINPERVSLITFGLSIASAGAAGVAMAMVYAFYPAVQSVWTLFVFLVTIVGGVGSVIGSALAGLLIGFIIGVSAAFLPFVWTNVILFALLLIVLLFKPEGLFAT